MSTITELDPKKFSEVSLPSVKTLRVYHSIPENVENPPRLIFFHGFTRFVNMYTLLLARLSEKFEVLAYDSPGTGGSSGILTGSYSLDSFIEVALELLSSPTFRWIPRAARTLFRGGMRYDPATITEETTLDSQEISKSLVDSISSDRKTFTIVGHSVGGLFAAALANACWPHVSNVHMIAPAGILCPMNNYWTKLSGGIFGFAKRFRARLFPGKTIEGFIETQAQSWAIYTLPGMAARMEEDFTRLYRQNASAAVDRFLGMVSFPWSESSGTFEELNKIIAQTEGITAHVHLMGDDKVIPYTPVNSFFDRMAPSMKVTTYPSVGHDWVMVQPVSIVREIEKMEGLNASHTK